MSTFTVPTIEGLTIPDINKVFHCERPENFKTHSEIIEERQKEKKKRGWEIHQSFRHPFLGRHPFKMFYIT